MVKNLIEQAISGRAPNSTGWIRVNCPVCYQRHGDNDSRHSLGVHHITGVFKCHRCLVRGRLKNSEILADEIAHVQLKEEFELPVEAQPLFGIEPPKTPHAQQAFRYLTEPPPLGRGFNQLQLCLSLTHFAYKGEWSGRILFPHYYYDRLWGWTGRSYTSKHELRVRYPAFMTRELLYNQEVLDAPTDLPVLVAESVTSSVRQLPHAVATLGQPIPEQIATLIQKSRRPLIIALDGDRWRDCRRLARELRYAGRQAKAILLPAGLDPADFSDDRVNSAIEHLTKTPDLEVDFSPAEMVEVEEYE